MNNKEIGIDFRGAFHNKPYDWRMLRDQLNSFKDDDPILDQEVEALPNRADHQRPVRLLPVLAADTVENLCGDEETRSAKDFTHNSEQFILLLDASPFDEEGNSFFTWQEDGSFIGNKTGKIKPSISPKVTEGFATTIATVQIVCSNQFGPESAINMIKDSLKKPAILDVAILKVLSNYVVHQTPSKKFKPYDFS